MAGTSIVTLAVIARLDRAIQYSETPVIEWMSRGVLDAPPSRGMTVRYAEAVSRHDAPELFMRLTALGKS
ncbi:hypothetical protein S58_02400 [Bradyrhizobium oligotrophicum S58]|uniref:Uncharacterized protein n=1 Tax=Bradyrhizobium oligotrophicum S58 TaxID=1245469 RepID=M4Z087_9BRAD|nr:hypothetical protein S58_02400 [Bradyrhizobium oligotrophicum S58]